MIRRYLIFCSVIYHFYTRKKESAPSIYVFWGSSLVLSFNFLVIYETVGYFIYPLPFSKAISFVFLSIISLLNYIFFIKPAKYKEITPKKRDGLYSIIYIIITALLVILMANLQRDKNLSSISEQHLEENRK